MILKRFNQLNEGIFDTNLSKAKAFLREKSKECEIIISDYEDGQDDKDINKKTYQKASIQLEIITQIMDILNIV